MIKNIIFDLSGVLLNYDINNYLTYIGLTKEEIKNYKPLIWGSKEWLQGDLGAMTYEEITNSLVIKYPKYKKIRYIMENKNNDLLLSEKEDTIKYLKELKEKGFKIYFLSNVSAWDLEYNMNKSNFFKLADGAVYSCDIKAIKPAKECYLSLLNKYNLVPEECIFIDDTKENIEAAKKLGIIGIHFDSLDRVKEKVNDIIK